MMTIKHFYSLLALLLISLSSNGQNIVRGIVTNAKTGDPVVDAKVSVNGVGKLYTDLDGAYNLRLAPGKYTLAFSQTLDGFIDEEREIEVVAGEVLIVDVQMSTALTDVDEVVVTGRKAPPTSDKKLDEDRAEGEGTTDNIGKEAMQKKGIQTAVDAVATTPGASVEDGKNVYIRGLGDRYTKTILNGMDIPGLDPDRNSVQLDIFPTVLVDKITVYKTFTPNLSADFTGGLIDITTQDFPTKKTLYFKGGLGYNTNATFNPDFISYEGGSLDFLGFDDGTRRLPISSSTEIPHPALQDPVTATITQKFSETMATEKAFSFMNQNYAFATGNQKNFYVGGKKGKDSTRLTYGYNVVLNYRTSNTYFKDVQYNEYIMETDPNQTELFRDRTSKGEQTESNVLWTALLGQSIKFGKSKFSLTLFHTQNGTKSAANLRETNYDSNQAVLLKQGLQYSQRSVTNANITGTHFLDEKNKWKLIWKLSPTYSRISDPDIRSTAIEESDTPGPNGEVQYLWEESVGAEVRRIFRSLNEYNLSGRFDFERKFMQWDSLESTLSFGGLTTYKNRTFDVAEYVFKLYNTPNNVVPNDPNWFFEDENVWNTDTYQGTYATGQQERANIYEANQMINSAYVMNELPLSKSFSATYGARVERSINRYTGQSNNADFDTTAPRYVNEVVLNNINLLPSLNMVYKIRKDADSSRYERKTNFRAAYTQTVARPSFREISISQIYDPIQGRRYLGNIDLKQTLIHNADVRWEHFFGRTEIISLSGFYKRFINPIEIVANVAAPNEFIPVNAGVADVYGGEFEFRKAIGFNKKSKEHLRFVVGGNFTYVISQIDMNKVTTEVGGVKMTEKEVRQANARNGEVIGDYRTMYGQSPYIVNGFVNFSDDSLFLSCNVSYNVQGKKLAVIGVGLVPDVFEQPFHSLNVKVSKGFGKVREGESAPRWKASITGRNLLNQARRRYYESFNAKSQVFDYLHQGTTVSASISYTIK
ncbi:MAG: carboxypeptidase-like regulatory domain-containing protein [Flavobacteriales bacterium]|nr:carboxypeptidase-like regulatory domain-containing protein [Flavobacteriales bacterium]